MHTHFSLFEGDKNAFFDPAAEYHLSNTARQFMAGILRHAPEITLVTNQYVNSYKRLWGGGEAPSYVSWGHNNRSALVRVPLHKPEKAQSTRIEYRAMDSAANPYLAYSLLLAAGLKGIENQYELEAETEQDVWTLSYQERRAMGIEALPQSLDHAIKKLEDSELAAEVLGESVFNFVLANKRNEWADYRAQVTPYEIDQNLKTL
jgi:glutamine synthetase